MKLSGVIEALIAAGGSVDQIAAVIRAAEAEQQVIDDARREKATNKKRAQRVAEELSGDNRGRRGTKGDVMGRKGTALSPPLPLPPLPPNPQPHPAPTPPHTHETPGFLTETAPKGASSVRGSALPDDWQPKVAHYAKAEEQGCDHAFVDNLAEAMREWAGANRNRPIARKADWDLTFHGFLRREMENPKQRARPANGHARGSPPGKRSVTSVAHELYEEMGLGHH